MYVLCVSVNAEAPFSPAAGHSNSRHALSSSRESRFFLSLAFSLSCLRPCACVCLSSIRSSHTLFCQLGKAKKGRERVVGISRGQKIRQELPLLVIIFSLKAHGRRGQNFSKLSSSFGRGTLPLARVQCTSNDSRRWRGRRRAAAERRRRRRGRQSAAACERLAAA